MYALSTEFPPGHFKAAEAEFINEVGEIAGTGTLPNSDLHAYVLIPARREPRAANVLLPAQSL